MAGITINVTGGGGSPAASYVTTAAEATLSGETTLGSLIGRGVVASRPAFGTAGRLYFATDENKLYRDTGSAWEDVSALVAHDHTGATDGGTLEGAKVTTFLELSEASAPSTPASGLVRIYAKSDGSLYQKDDTGAESNLAATASGGAGAPMGAQYIVVANDPDLTNEKALGTDIIPTAAYASRPAAAIAGRLFLPSDGFVAERDTGSAYAGWGPLFPLTAPVDGDFAWVNQGGASVVTTYGGIHLVAPAGAGVNLRARIKTAPATPYTVTVLVLPLSFPVNYNQFGLVFRQSSDGKVAGLSIEGNTGSITGYKILSQKWTSATVYSAAYTSVDIPMGGPVWMRIADNGTNRILSWSADGQNWVVIHTVGRTDFLTADQIGFYASADNATWPVALTLLSWKQA